jgi:hypothetical protein
MYRDEREVLRDEVMQLRRELEQSKTDRERLAKLEQLLEIANREVNALRGQFGGPSMRRPGPNAMMIAIVAVVLFAAMSAGFFLTARSRSSVSTTAPQAQTQTAATVEPVATTPTPAPVAVPTAAPVAPMPPPVAAKPAKSAHAVWHATITKSQGLALAAGTACTVDATVSSDSSGMGVDDLVLTCGGKKLYDTNDELEGMSSNDSDAKQYNGEKPGSWTYGMAYSDVGARGPSKNQIAIDSIKQIGKVWSDNLPDFRVDFSIKTKSDPVDVEIETQ